MAAINPQKIFGRWRSGVALDFRTISSAHMGVNEAGHNVFETKRTELGELLYRLKYHSDISAAMDIIITATRHLSARGCISISSFLSHRRPCGRFNRSSSWLKVSGLASAYR